MKKKDVSKKLVINKETIARLEINDLESIKVKGGAISITCKYPLSNCVCDTLPYISC